LTWSEGHNWYAEIPFSKVVEELSNTGDQRFEFKFMIKVTESNGHIRVSRWEGGSINHMYDGQAVQNYLKQPKVRQRIIKNMELSTKQFMIGTFKAGSSQDLIIEGESRDNLAPCPRKTILGYS